MGPKRSSDQLSTLTATPIEQIAANGTPRRQSREAIALVQEQRAVRSEDREFGAPCVCGAENFQRVIVERVFGRLVVTDLVACVECWCVHFSPLPKPLPPRGFSGWLADAQRCCLRCAWPAQGMGRHPRHVSTARAVAGGVAGHPGRRGPGQQGQEADSLTDPPVSSPPPIAPLGSGQGMETASCRCPLNSARRAAIRRGPGMRMSVAPIRAKHPGHIHFRTNNSANVEVAV